MRDHGWRHLIKSPSEEGLAFDGACRAPAQDQQIAAPWQVPPRVHTIG